MDNPLNVMESQKDEKIDSWATAWSSEYYFSELIGLILSDNVEMASRGATTPSPNPHTESATSLKDVENCLQMKFSKR